MARVFAAKENGAVADVLVLTTGGTIDKLYFDALSTYQIGESVVDRVLKTARVTLSYRIAEVMRKDSLELTDDDRALIARTVADAPEQRIIITHGTDTMAQTAQALGSTAGKTIVLVGALSPARFAESDATFNLGMAFATAQVAASGIWIAMNGTVFDGLRVRKDRAANAFVAVE
ncbi:MULTISPECIES: asparaginase domain-containing protein [unclassified Sphingomonas]|uniref:asparaginase domain-containing protein n=1 Tax=Sphingomonas sp. IC4-52 TaxID=2887202 RepID=UPI001D10ACB5|nr:MULTISPECIES: asparaginase domain-containing protein [unclassified Sphingomonas]MCC2979274.1 asparaginase [Sphingomonas sp. IC4-52]MCD2315493.1 asparaginase [Sphingomonas sp. IC-11]